MNRYAVVREIIIRKRVEVDAETPIAATEGAAPALDDLEDHSNTIFFNVKTTTDLIGGLS